MTSDVFAAVLRCLEVSLMLVFALNFAPVLIFNRVLLAGTDSARTLYGLCVPGENRVLKGRLGVCIFYIDNVMKLSKSDFCHPDRVWIAGLVHVE